MTDKTFTYDSDRDCWIDGTGRMHIRCEGDPENIVYVDISTSYLFAVYKGNTCAFDLKYFTNNEYQQECLLSFFKYKLKKRAASYLNKITCVFDALNNHCGIDIFFTEHTLSEIEWVWSKIKEDYRAYFRELYKFFARHDMGCADKKYAYYVNGWIARKKIELLRDVRNWDPHTGSLIIEECMVFRRALRREERDKVNPDYHATRLFGLLVLETLKRPSQILACKANCVKVVGETYFVEIPPAKAQLGREARWWPITKELGTALLKYSERPYVKRLQTTYDRLIVWKTPSLLDNLTVSSGMALQTLKTFVKDVCKVISPRTGKPLHVTPNRLRHTGATLMAYRGVPRELIMEMLEHDSIFSARAYIDSVLCEIAIAIKHASNRNAGLFKRLHNAFFGIKNDEQTKKPRSCKASCNRALPVGECSRDPEIDGPCPNSPLHCYDECPDLEAWPESGIHNRVLESNLGYLSNVGIGSEQDRHLIGQFEPKVREELTTLLRVMKDLKWLVTVTEQASEETLHDS